MLYIDKKGDDVLCRFCVVVALAAAFGAASAPTSRASAATAASACSHLAASSHRSSSYRSLSSAETSMVHNLCAKAHKPITVLRFHRHHLGTIAPGYPKWWNVPNKQWRRIVKKHRAIVRHSKRVLVRLSRQIAELIQPKLPASLVADLKCIHGGEGAWNSNTGNGYYGGLQMDYSFMSTYGPEFLHRWGTADNWPIWAQLTVAIRAHDSGRGFAPWPNTARNCGLL